MIEVEKKFKLTEKQKERLLADAELIGERVFKDVYFDRKDFNLSLQDIWLRKRGEEFQLKLPLNKNGSERVTDQYQEIIGENRIRQVFDIPQIKTFEEDIAQFGYQIFCSFVTTRRKYKKGKFIIDIDVANFGDYQTEVCEIELMVDESNEVENAAVQIMHFAQQLGLENIPVRGKVLEYLYKKRPEHYRALAEKGLILEN